MISEYDATDDNYKVGILPSLSRVYVAKYLITFHVDSTFIPSYYSASYIS